jgi:hypothetical protein
VPGGFLSFLRRVAPAFTIGVATYGLAVVINGLMVMGLAADALVGPAVASVALSGAAGRGQRTGHLAAAVPTRGYAPGVVTGELVSLPVAVAAYTALAGRSADGRRGGERAAGVAYHLVPLAWFGLHRRLAGPAREDATLAAGG